mmetsp:Transcript_2324/g.6464  ORF Transcript_2324/g.6464 Transcript_2324/m.6464 type:complete len:270 (-) Transcript_2324:48-857(-)
MLAALGKVVAAGAGIAGASLYMGLIPDVGASGDHLPAPLNRPPMTTKLLAYDTASLRRGYQVYKEVCATCHSLDGIRYGQLVNVVLLEEEAKKEAAEVEVVDGPDDTGEMFERPGKLTDALPRPYPNEEAARYANNGALPPPLTLIIGARHNGSHYLFSLLTGYQSAPAGVQLGDNMHYNPYFVGGQIAMPPPLSDEMVEYDDGTEASVSQMAKDVTHFLEWALAPQWADNKHTELKKAVVALGLAGVAFYWNKQKWSVLKTRQLRRFK